MAEPITTTHKSAEVKTGHLRVVCDGPASGHHPRVFLTMVDDAEGHPSHVVCPYCSQVFTYDAKLATPGSNHH